MGLNLARVSFREWFIGRYKEAFLNDYICKLEKLIGKKINIENWTLPEDDDYPRVGSYVAYYVFVICMAFVSQGFKRDELEPDEDIELEALKVFENNLESESHEIVGKDHFLLTNDSDTLFIPIQFDRPAELYEDDIASLPMGIKALEDFADALNFALDSDMDDEYIDPEGWQPINTAKNVARIIHSMFTKDTNCCVSFA